jgi:5-amino-6-(5-phosphoribosylamino)uracil reductase
MQVVLVLAMSLDGKLANQHRDADKFASRRDFWQLEQQVAQADGVLIGAGTLRAHGTTMRVLAPASLATRQAQGRSPQPVQILCSTEGTLDPDLPFFRQPVPRWLLTTAPGAAAWQDSGLFDRLLTSPGNSVDWPWAIRQLQDLGLGRLCVLGGAAIATALWELDLIDEFYLTLCPVLFGGAQAPTPWDGAGLRVPKKMTLVNCEVMEGEVFLHYCRGNLP